MIYLLAAVAIAIVMMNINYRAELRAMTPGERKHFLAEEADDRP